MAARRDGELFRSPDAQLYIAGDEESVLLQSGEFALLLVKNALSKLAAVVAMVGAVQWPVGWDCEVERTGEASFSFSLPGPLSYSLVFRGTTSAEDSLRLEKLLEEYATICSSTAQELPAAAAVDTVKHEGAEVESCTAAGMSLEMEGRLQRARRMSAIAKVFFKSLESGTIDAASHVKPMAMATQAARSSSSLSMALAGVDAVAKVVQAVEMGGRTLLHRVGPAVSSETISAQGASHGSSDLICSGWTLNDHGLLMLYRFITTSMALHSGMSSSRSGSSSSSTELKRRLLSSPSSSSVSSKSPSRCGQAGADASNHAGALPPPVPSRTASSPPPPPPPPLFTPCVPPPARMSEMTPPPLDSQVLSPFCIYRPRPKPAMPSSTQAATPLLIPRPPRFRH